MIVRAPFGDPPTLSSGDSGQAVQQLQTDLAVLGLMPAVDVDGVFGSETQTAVTQFQTNNGLTANGIADSGTWAAILAQVPVGWVDPTTGASSGSSGPVQQVTAAAAGKVAAAAKAIGVTNASGGINWMMVAGISIVSVGGLVVLFGLIRRRRPSGVPAPSPA